MNCVSREGIEPSNPQIGLHSRHLLRRTSTAAQNQPDPHDSLAQPAHCLSVF
jgi:hypothetical protein